MIDEIEYLTQEKHDEFIKELEYLKKTRRREIAENLEYAKSLGDLSENAEYQEAREMQANIEDRIARLEALLKSAKIVSGVGSDMVSVGSVITVSKQGSKDEPTYTIVGSEEADISQGKISIRSPFGKAVLGKKKGDSFDFETPAGLVHYKILRIK
ncbi:MAG: transcription elongation factor GreA [Patescibacteria group bacterium]